MIRVGPFTFSILVGVPPSLRPTIDRIAHDEREAARARFREQLLRDRTERLDREADK